MSYYTHYSLEIESQKFTDIEIIKELREFSEDAKWALFEDGGCADEATWRKWEEDLLEISAKYPEALFTLMGDGEEAEDIWRCYFQNGKCQLAEAEIKIAEFDPNKLKDRAYP